MAIGVHAQKVLTVDGDQRGVTAIERPHLCLRYVFVKFYYSVTYLFRSSLTREGGERRGLGVLVRETW